MDTIYLGEKPAPVICGAEERIHCFYENEEYSASVFLNENKNIQCMRSLI